MTGGFEHRPAAGKLVVGYQHTAAGKDAVNLAVALARGRNISLEIVMAEPLGSPYGGTYPHDRGYESIVEERIAGWLKEALDMVPEGIAATAKILVGESEVRTLLDYGAECGADGIVVGARQGGLFNRFHMGSVVNALLHSSTIPVALAPSGFSHPGPVTRSTAFFGPKPGAADVVATAVDRCQRRGIPLRLVSLILKDEVASEAVADASVVAAGSSESESAALRLLSRVVPADLTAVIHRMLDAGTASVEIAQGRSIEEALSTVTFEPGELAVLGSSRLAVPGRLFLGPTAARILRNIPVPILVVPAGFMQTES